MFWAKSHVYFRRKRFINHVPNEENAINPILFIFSKTSKIL